MPVEESNDDLAIAGFGDMAMSLIGQIVPRIRREPDRRYSIFRGPPRRERGMVLLQHDELSGQVDWGGPDTPRPLDKRNRILFVTFQLAMERPELMEEAIQFAERHGDSRRKIIAVIPHLPDEFARPGQLANDILPKLNNSFDAVWALSDRSPYLRQALPYGPARSLQASATNLRYLLGLARDEKLRAELVPEERAPWPINVIGSSTGDRPIPKLVEHAMMRLAHYLFDFLPVISVRVESEGSANPLDDASEEVVRREAPDALVEIAGTRKRDGGPTRVFVALKGVSIGEGGAEQFEQYCVNQLERAGWGVDQFEPNGSVHLSRRGFENVTSNFKYVAKGSLDTALRARQRRDQVGDNILLTNAIIKRRIFALQVLNGSVPIHYSRIGTLARIYGRRYA